MDKSLLSFLTFFNVIVTEKVFIMGVGYNKFNKDKWQLINYLSGEAKKVVYVSKNQCGE